MSDDTLSEWAAEGEQRPKKQYTPRRFGRPYAVFMFWLFLCLIIIVSGPELLSWLIGG